MRTVVSFLGFVSFLAFASQSPVIQKLPEPPVRTINLERELLLQDEGSQGRPIFFNISTFRVDEDRNLYILDTKGKKISKFSKEGRLLYSVGTQGKGPGELLLPIILELGYKGTILVYDAANRRIVYFARDDGRIVEELSTARYPRIIRLDDDEEGSFYAFIKIYEAQNQSYVLRKLDHQLNQVNDLFVIKEKLTEDVNPYPPSIFFRILPMNQVLFGDNRDYRLNVADPKGDVIKIIQVKASPLRFRESEKKEILEGYSSGPNPPNLVFPAFYPLVDHVITDSAGTILVRTYKRDSKGNTFYNMFNLAGKPIASFSTSTNIHCISGDRMYCLEENKEGYQQISIYRYRFAGNRR